MIKGVFVLQNFNKEAVDQSLELGANAVFVGHKKLDGDLMEKLHQSGVKVFAEVGLFAGEDLREKFPDSRPVDSNGQEIEKEGWYVGVSPNEFRQSLQAATVKLSAGVIAFFLKDLLV